MLKEKHSLNQKEGQRGRAARVKIPLYPAEMKTVLLNTAPRYRGLPPASWDSYSCVVLINSFCLGP